MRITFRTQSGEHGSMTVNYMRAVETETGLVKLYGMDTESELLGSEVKSYVGDVLAYNVTNA